MAYEKQNFVDGQVLTAHCLNCIEDCLVDLETDINENKSSTEAAQTTADNALQEIEVVRTELANVSINPDDLGLEQDLVTGLVYPTYQGVRSENGIPVISADGTIAYTITLKNTLESRYLLVAEGSEVVLKFSYSSVDENGYDDGSGIGVLLVDEIKVATFDVDQGDNTLDVSPYLPTGEHTVKIRVSNSEGTTRTIPYTINLVSLKMTTTLDDISTYSGDVTFYYTPVGSGNKTIHFLMDGVELDTEVVSSTNKSCSYIIPAQEHGGHVFEAYAVCEIGGIPVSSNIIKLGMLWLEPDNQTAGIVSTFDVTETTQGETLSIDYLAYDPMSESATVSLIVLNPDNTVYSSKDETVSRTAQTWTVDDYPIGSVTFRLSVAGVHVDKIVDVAESDVVIERITDSLVFDFDASGRSNQENNPGVWTDGNVSATFEGVTFAGSDGWLTDEDGAFMLRLLPGSEMTIPFTMFATDHRTNGATVEVEMATHNVRDYDSVVMSCLSGGRGFKIASQYAQLRSEQSEISMQFKEEKRVRVSFVVGPKNLMRMVYVFVDGIMCGAIQYPENDDFSQNPAVGITIGAESSGIDVYRIAMYNKGLNRQEVLKNYIADRATLKQRIDAHKRNDVLDVSDNVVITKLPTTLPYMIISSAELPLAKKNPKPCEITYVDPANDEKSFTATGATVDVQGTSSAGYKKKNFLISLENGLTLTKDGSTAEKYALSDQSIPVSVFCLKADVASSDNANNVELVRLYNDTCPYRHPAMEADPRVRYGVEGHPIVVFWQNTATGETQFWGKYNFNNDKSTPEPFGWGDGYECWEIKNNVSNRVLFKTSDYSDGWGDDFEAVYPDGLTDYTNLKTLTDWIASTNRETVSTEEEKAALLEKFKSEFEDYFVKDAMLYYYLFTETFLMVDNRAKNFFPTYDPNIQKWYPFPYDMDTALGINNEGQLVFDYDLEDTDQVGGYNVYNAQESVLWCNVRDAFANELQEMYADLRNTSDSDGVTPFSYESVFQRFDEHQAAWPEAVWNEDAYEKYLAPLHDDNDASYLSMLQGPKASQRDWWSFNGFRYRDSKYMAGDANTNFITLRCYALGGITVTPYSHIHARIKYGSYTVGPVRAKRNESVPLENPADTLTDTETYIYSADRLADIGDLSALQVGYADFTAARKLQRLKLGDGAEDYENTKLTELYVGNNDLLTELDIQNCVGLMSSVDLSRCDGLETVKAKGSATTGLNFAVGGRLTTLELPGTITNFTVRDHRLMQSVSFEGYDAMTTIRVENTPNVPIEAILTSASNLGRVRLIGVEWEAESEEALRATITKLKACKGMDADNNNTDVAVVTGRVYVSSISDELLAEINTTFPELIVVVNGVAMYLVRFVDYDGTILYSTVVSEGDDVADPVTSGAISTPTRASTAQYTYTYTGWDASLTNVTAPIVARATYAAIVRTYTVNFYNGSTLLQTVTVPYGYDAVYSGEEPTDPVCPGFIGWKPEPTNIQSDLDCYAQFEDPYEEQWAAVFASIDAGTYATDYAIGDTVPLDLGSEGLIHMQIAAFDTDDLADGSGKAPITWIAKELLNTDQRMNPAVVTNDDGTFQEGTGSTGGWEKCEMRAYLNDTIKPLIPERVRTAIKGIKNTHSSRNINGNFVNTSTSYDEVWIPGSGEIYIPGDPMVDPGVYAELFTATGRKKYKNGYTYSSSWWTRDAGNSSSLFTRVNNQGDVIAGNACNADRAYSICLCFCT